MIAEHGGSRADYRVFYEIPTRWMDNDVYGHVNNVHYYSYFDTAIAYFLIGEGGLDPWRSEVIGFCVESACRFRRATRFPDRITAGLRVSRLGRTSVRYEIGLFRDEDQETAADGYFVHVFVTRADERPAPIPPAFRAALARLFTDSALPPS
jgi:acyl-CoA thioester hydrolase